MWIKIDHSLPQKPEVYLIAQRLNISRAEVVGHLVSFWLWADQMSEDGYMTGNRAMVDSITLENFANSLVDVGWLHFTDDGEKIEIVNFERHNGQSAKKRATNAQKVAEHRKRKKLLEQSTEKPQKVTQPLLDKEKKRKENIDYDNIVDIWNNNVIGAQTPRITKLTEKRKSAIRLLLKEFTIEDFGKVCVKLITIPYLQGKNDHGWIANFDYVIRPDKFVKILEGGWDSKPEENKTNTFDEWNQ